MSAQALRQRYTRTFAGLEKYSSLKSWLIVGLYVLQLLAAAILGHFLLGNGVSALEGAIVALLMLFVATRLRGLNNIIHECSHATFASDRAANTLIGKVCAALLFNSFKAYRDEHLSHHAHLGDYEQDMDLHGIRKLGLHDPLTFGVVARHIFTPLCLRHLRYYLGLNCGAEDGRLFQAMKLALMAGILLVAAVAPMTAIFMLIVPFVFVFTALNYWADCMDHAGLVPTEDDLEGSRNTLAPHVIRWLFFPRNDCFHLVHHLFPHVPARHLEATHGALLADELYASRENAVRLMRAETLDRRGITMTPAE